MTLAVLAAFDEHAQGNWRLTLVLRSIALAMRLEG
jgi:hypothetical protein